MQAYVRRRSDRAFKGGMEMQVKSLAALLTAFFLCTTGCHLRGGCGAGGCDSGACGPGGGCSSGTCGGLMGLFPGARGGALLGSSCASGNCATPEMLSNDGYGTRGGLAGPLAGHFGQHHRGPQSHMGQYPGPADGPASPTVTYPYYTTRAPRDFLRDDPPSIGP